MTFWFFVTMLTFNGFMLGANAMAGNGWGILAAAVAAACGLAGMLATRRDV